MPIKKSNYVLGINAYHGDSAACLIENGRIIAAVEEERFNRVKHWAGFPVESIKYCIEYAGITLNDIESVAINHNPKARLFKKIKYSFASYSNFRLALERFSISKKKTRIIDDFIKHFPYISSDLNIKYIEHHEAHIASTFYASNFEESVCLSIDGFGDFASASWGVGRKESIILDGDILFPHSLGIFYQAITQFLGFPKYGDEYKVMGLASYGNPVFMDEMNKIVLLRPDGEYRLDTKYFLHTKEKVAYKWSNCEPSVGKLYSDQLVTLLGSPRAKDETLTQMHKDIAASCQKMYELALFNLLNYLQDKYKLENLCLAGGCAMNSVANGRIYSNTNFKKIYVQAAGGDAGGALGAAFSGLQAQFLKNSATQMPHAYWGPGYDEEYVKKLIDKNISTLNSSGCKVTLFDDEEILIRVAELICNGQVVGWFQNRMEWGARALGNRSILGDPRREDMKDILNSKIKRRESFRPFAPSILQDKSSEWFEIYDEVPFMGQVAKIREAKRDLIPAVTHVDGTGRLQTVSPSTNPKFYKLIKRFEEITGVPIILNTSFNENEPIVCTPEEAMSCFLRTNMDVLVMGNYLISRA
jgi:carbamoyltransferase